jgi:EAL domain-containing protein (putative c-di-GMP-specific phosphodiesterase class I)
MSTKTIAELLAAALSQEQFVLHSQQIRPISSDPSARPFQEILVRFQREEDTLLPPGMFFPILEEEGLLPLLDRWVVGRVIKWIHSGVALNPGWSVPRNSVNLDAKSVGDTSFISFVKKHLNAAQTPGHAVGFEIPWSLVQTNGAEVQGLMNGLRPAGCFFTLAGVAGDDQSLSVLRYLKPDYIKISTGLTRALRGGVSAAQGVSLVHAFCQSLHIRTVAEQVEDDETLQTLKTIGIDYAQGFGVSPPRELI